MQPRYIAIAGNIGSGKSTLVKFICDHYDLEPYYEPNENNPYLKDFYGDMKRWAFHSQAFFLTYKFRIHQELEREVKRARRPLVQDRTIYEDAEIFAYNLYRRRTLSKRDYQVYRDLYEAIIETLNPPDLLIYLRAKVSTLRKRIAMRARPEEQDIPVGYLRGLNTLYEDWIGRWDKSELLVVETDNMDYITDMVDRLDLFATVEKYLRRR